MGQPVSEVPSKGAFVINFFPHADSKEMMVGSLLHIVGGGDLLEPVALVKGEDGELYSVGISRLVTRKMP